ncbi:MAG: hypothetical protein KF747_21345 [Nitrospira sp.]|nr:hypothetical protein [Nitrospira sp.]
MIEIEIKQLQMIANKLFDHIIHSRGVQKITLDKNFYWDIPLDELYDVEKRPELVMGSLYDDWEFVSDLLDKNSDPVSVSLTELAPLLRHLGGKIGQ